jgi:hypothetical protein
MVAICLDPIGEGASVNVEVDGLIYVLSENFVIGFCWF